MDKALSPLKQSKRINFSYAFIVPAFIFYSLFWMLPVLISFYDSLISVTGEFGFENFTRMFADESFVTALSNTLIFAGLSLILQFILALGLAFLINTNFRGSKLLLFIIIIPMTLPPSAVGILWNTGLIQSGWLNSIIYASGLQNILESANVLTEPIVWKNIFGLRTVLLLVLVDTWTVLPTVTIIILAGLQNFNKEFKESALVFGANRFQVIKDIIIPIIKPSIITALLLRLIAGLQVWLIGVMIFGFNRVPFLLERIVYYIDGVPNATYSYKLAVTYSVFTLLVVLAVSIFFLRITRGNERRNQK
jgi:multiple sugar transport system permease protein